MKVRIIKPCENFKAGDVVEATTEEFDTLHAGGYALSEDAYLAREALKATNRNNIVTAVARAKTRGAVAPKDETVQAKALDRYDKNEASADVLVELIDGMPAQADQDLAVRATSYQREINGVGNVRVMRCDPKDAAIRACEHQDKQFGLLKAGKVKEATELSREAYTILASEVMPLLKGGGDFMLKDIVRAADVTDTNLGTIAGSLVLMRNLGYLKNILNFLPYISTDLRNEPAKFNQPIFSRYVVVPSVTSYSLPTTTGTGTTFQQTGGWSPSTASTVDVSVTINNHKGVQVSFDTQLLGSTARAILSEQISAQTYALGEQVTKDFLTSLFGATWNGVVSSYKLGANFNLSSMVAIKNRATLSKIPPVGRFALFHSYYHDAILTDSNLVTAKAITALVNKDLTALESAELPVLYGVKPLESQLSSAKAGVLTSPTISADGSTVDFATPGITQVGFLGNMSSMLLAARIPQDYTQAFPDIPATAAIQVVTDPDSGMSVLNCRYVNHQLAQVSNRLSLMYGFGQGDSRIGIVFTP